MARIPVVREQTVRQQGFQAATMQAPPAAAMGVNLEPALTQLDDMAARWQDEANQVATMDADSALQEWENEYLYNPESGALNARGRNAFGLPEQSLSDFDKRASEVAANLNNDRQRQAFQKTVQARRAQIQSTVNRHVSRETEVYASEQTQSYVQRSREAAALNYNDPERIGMEIERQWGAIYAQGRREGWSPEAMATAREQAVSNTQRVVLEQIMARDPGAAMRRYAQVAPEMLLADRQALAPAIKQVSIRQQARSVVGAITGQGSTGPDGVWARIIQQESGNRQFGRDGQPLTSSAGAIGVAQLMPATAPEAARMAGLPWDEELYRTDADYNEQLGRAYFDNMAGKYDGDVFLAAAAYNAGPGMVDDWINGTNKTGKNSGFLRLGDPRKGEISHADWVAAVPFNETRNYVQTVTRNADPEPQQAASRAQQLAMLSGLPKEVRDIARDEIDVQWEAYEAQKEERYTAAQEEIEGGALVDNLAPELVAQLTNTQLSALRARSRELNGIQPENNWERWTQLNMMSDSELAAIADPYTELRPLLDDTHYNRALGMINEAKGNAGDNLSTSSTLTFKNRVSNAAISADIIPASGQPSKSQAERFALFERAADLRVNAWERNEGRKASSEEMTRILDDMLLENVNTGGREFFRFGSLPGIQLGGRGDRYGFELEEDEIANARIPERDIPESDIEMISNLLTSNGHAPSRALIERAFAQYRLNNREAFFEIIQRGE